MADNSAENLINETIKNIKSIVDITTIVGSPIISGDKTIIPVSKATIGLLVGGGEIAVNNKYSSPLPFSGASGAGINITPIAFLVCSSDKWEILPVSVNSNLDEIISFGKDILKGIIKNDS